MPKESDFQADLIKELNEMVGNIGYVLKLDGSYIQGFPDILILCRDQWAALECKRSAHAERQPNQEFYVGHLNALSFAAFIHPGNKEEVIDGLREALRLQRHTRVSITK